MILAKSPSLPHDIIEQIEEVATFRYIDLDACKRWNAQRREGELRLLTGWQWSERGGTEHRGGFKTLTVAAVDAFYTLVKHQATPRITRLRVVARRAA